MWVIKTLHWWGYNVTIVIVENFVNKTFSLTISIREIVFYDEFKIIIFFVVTKLECVNSEIVQLVDSTSKGVYALNCTSFSFANVLSHWIFLAKFYWGSISIYIIINMNIVLCFFRYSFIQLDFSSNILIKHIPCMVDIQRKVL